MYVKNFQAFSRRLFWLGQSNGLPDCHAVKSGRWGNWETAVSIFRAEAYVAR